MRKEYKAGNGFDRTKKIGIISVEAVVIAYFCIYNYAWNVDTTFLFFVFVLIGIVFGYLTNKIMDWYKKSIRYVVTDEGLLVGREGKEQLYRWEEFSGVRMERVAYFSLFPVVYVISRKDDFGKVTKRDMKISNVVSGIVELTEDVIRLTKGYAEVDQEVYRRIKTYKVIK